MSTCRSISRRCGILGSRSCSISCRCRRLCSSFHWSSSVSSRRGVGGRCGIHRRCGLGSGRCCLFCLGLLNSCCFGRCVCCVVWRYSLVAIAQTHSDSHAMNESARVWHSRCLVYVCHVYVCASTYVVYYGKYICIYDSPLLRALVLLCMKRGASCILFMGWLRLVGCSKS